MKIAMLARNPNLYSHKRLKEAAEQRGHELDILNTTRCTVHIASHRPEVYYNGEPVIGYDAVIPRIGGSDFRAEITLADRSDMKFPMLVGRSSLRRRFVVDSGYSWLQSAGLESVRGHKS